MPPGCGLRSCPATGRKVRAWERERKDISRSAEIAARSSQRLDVDSQSRRRREDRLCFSPSLSSMAPETLPEKSAARAGSVRSATLELRPPGAPGCLHGGEQGVARAT